MGGAWKNSERRPLSISKRVFCEHGDRKYGLPLIIEELKKHDFQATFFTEVFFSQSLGTDQAQIIVDYLLRHKQDIQLHAHPVFRYYSLALKAGSSEARFELQRQGDAFSDKDADTQHSLLSEALDIFKSLVGECPRAFRAGGFLGDHNTIAACGRLGIPIDSSYNPAVRGSFPVNRPTPNVVQRLANVIELPLTATRTGLRGFKAWKPLAISSISLAELKTALSQAHFGGMTDLVLIFHSFSNVKSRDIFYSSIRPDWIVISRFRSLLKYLSDNHNMFDVSTVASISVNGPEPLFGDTSPVLDGGFLKPAIRKGTQALNRLYWI